MNLPKLRAFLLAGFLFAAHTEAQTPLIKVETVPVSHPGNANDTSNCGSVGYPYRIGKYEVTIDQYAVFLNSVAQTNTNSAIVNLWNSNMATDLNSAGISRGGVLGNYVYTVIGRDVTGSGQRPITYVSWDDAARFCNWLHNGATNGASTETGAYRLDGPFFPTSGPPVVVRNPDSKWWIPTADEWYKAAYYKGGSTNAGYWFYPTRSNVEPGNLVGDGANQANFFQMRRGSGGAFFSVTQTLYSTYSASQNYLTVVGAFRRSPGPHGTFDQGGNVSEWFGNTNGGRLPESWVGMAGGNWYSDGYFLSSEASRVGLFPSSELATVGFRVATKAAQSILPFAATNNVPFGATVTFTNTNSTAGLPVNFERVSGPVAISNNVATVTGVGTAVVRAVQGGNSNFNAATPLVSRFTTVKANQTITWTNFPATNAFQLNGKIPLNGTSSSGLRVVYTSANTNILRISGTNAIIRGRGTTSVTASQAGNANYNAASNVVRSIEIK